MMVSCPDVIITLQSCRAVAVNYGLESSGDSVI